MADYSYYIFHKPFGVLSQFTKEVPTHLTLADYIQLPSDVYPVGRLDKDTEGLLLLTNDNKLKTTLLDPEQHKSKTYLAQLDGDISDEALQQLAEGVTIRVSKKPYNTRPAKARRLIGYDIADRDPPVRYRAHIPTSWIQLVITEGKNRQVRKMCAAVGFPVLRLIRTAIGNLDIKLAAGELQELTAVQITKLLA